MRISGDGIPNYLDLDSDGDGIRDREENNDLDQDGIPDWMDTVFDERRLLACRSPACGPQMTDDETFSGGALFGQLTACLIMLGILPIWACIVPRLENARMKRVQCKHCNEDLISCSGGGISLELGEEFVASIADLTTAQAEEMLREEMHVGLDLFSSQLSVHLLEIAHNRAKFVINVVRQETAEHLAAKGRHDAATERPTENMNADADVGIKFLSSLPELVQAVISELENESSHIRASKSFRSSFLNTSCITRTVVKCPTCGKKRGKCACECSLCGDKFDCCPAMCRVRRTQLDSEVSPEPQPAAQRRADSQKQMKKTKSIKELLERPDRPASARARAVGGDGSLDASQHSSSSSEAYFEDEAHKAVTSHPVMVSESITSLATSATDTAAAASSGPRSQTNPPKLSYEASLMGVSFSLGRQNSAVDSMNSTSESRSSHKSGTLQADIVLDDSPTMSSAEEVLGTQSAVTSAAHGEEVLGTQSAVTSAAHGEETGHA